MIPKRKPGRPRKVSFDLEHPFPAPDLHSKIRIVSLISDAYLRSAVTAEEAIELVDYLFRS